MKELHITVRNPDAFLRFLELKNYIGFYKIEKGILSFYVEFIYDPNTGQRQLIDESYPIDESALLEEFNQWLQLQQSG